MEQDTRSQEIKSIVTEYMNELKGCVDISENPSSIKDAKDSGGKIRGIKGKIHEHLTNRIAAVALNDLINDGKISSGHVIGKEKGKKSKRRLFIKNKNNDTGCYLVLDNLVYVNDKPKVNLESRAFSDSTMCKPKIIDGVMLFENHGIRTILFELETGHVAVNTIPTILSYINAPNFKFDKISLLDRVRTPRKPIHTKEHYIEVTEADIEAAISKFKTIFAE